MSTTYLCDLCGGICDGGNVCGFEKEFHYCDEHWPEIEEYFAARDAAQEHLQREWVKILGKLHKDLTKKYPEGKIPDALG